MTVKRNSRGIVIGNVYDKYETNNPISRWLMNGFINNVNKLLVARQPKKILDVGCGEGHFTNMIHYWFPKAEIIGFDIECSMLRTTVQANKEILFMEASVYDIPFANNNFDLVVCLEVLEHLDQPREALHEIARVGKESLLASVPREPIWRMLNVLRGAYITNWGNTPGHIQHWSMRSFKELLSEFISIDDVASPLPWTIVQGTFQ